jgi:hypothetical protein
MAWLGFCELEQARETLLEHACKKEFFVWGMPVMAKLLRGQIERNLQMWDKHESE